FGFVLFISILNLNLVSASLCKGWDNYYHDCDDYYGYSEQHYDTDTPQYFSDYYKETDESKKTIESRRETYWGIESVKVVQASSSSIGYEKIKKNNPIVVYVTSSNKKNNDNSYNNNNYNSPSKTDCSNWRYKNSKTCGNSNNMNNRYNNNENGYYATPRQTNSGYYDWAW
ncbi:MAG: hypothetical protein AABW67_03560, partial [Nanoarchaeota archaeon]